MTRNRNALREQGAWEQRMSLRRLTYREKSSYLAQAKIKMGMRLRETLILVKHNPCHIPVMFFALGQPGSEPSGRSEGDRTNPPPQPPESESSRRDIKEMVGQGLVSFR